MKQTKTKKHKVTPLKRKNPLLSKAKRSKGMVDAGTVYGILLLSIIVGGGILLLGNAAPKTASPDNNQPVIIQHKTDNTLDPNLQLKDFPGITITPTPTPTSTPTPTPTTPPPATGGGGGSGKGDGGSSSCFVKGTKVLMADGSEKNIEAVKAGDRVKGFDGSRQTIETVLQMEAPIRDHHYNITLADGTVLGLTDEHPLYTLDGWKSINPVHTQEDNASLHVKTLVVGDKVLKSNGSYVTVVAMDYKPGSVQVYNLKQVSGNNDFFANDVLAHNKGNGGGSGGGGGSSGGSAL
jgi:uncharacterized membrane protein YgcG